MKDTYTFSNENGTFISFLDYEDEGDFPDFLSFFCKKLGLEVPSITETPYSLIAEFNYGGTDISASYGADAGCYVRIPPDAGLSARTIVEKCYGQAA